MHQKTIRRHLRALRASCIDDNADPILMRIAYAMECAVRRETEPGVVGWPPLEVEARALAQLLRDELAPFLADRVLQQRKVG